MNTLLESVLRFLRAEGAPTAVEYAVMLALVVVVCLAALTALGTTVNATFTTMDNAIAGSGPRTGS
jgi:pilus assembly protein Flp/PilA